MTLLTRSRTVFAPKRTKRFTLRHFLSLWRQRRHLSQVDDRLLKDIGLSRREAEIEAQRPLWDVPNHWLR